jgi:Xaa-Pro aminopeptidase
VTTAQATRLAELQARMTEEGLDLFVVQDPDSIVALAGYWNYLGMEFGRATLLAIPRDGAPVLITPAMEAEMARAMSWIEDIRPWADGLDGEWMAVLESLIAAAPGRGLAVEHDKTHPRVLALLGRAAGVKPRDATALIAALRMIKSPAEIAILRQAGQVAAAMAEAGRAAIGAGVPEYEVALAVIAGGTRKAAEFLAAEPPDSLAAGFTSPTIHNLQIMQSGRHTCMVHRRATVKTIRNGDPVYLCFCGIANFRNFKLGFDREFFVGSVTDAQARAYETTLAAQQAALAALRPGALAEQVHQAAEEIYRSAGYGAAYRTGRAFGYSFLEEPQLKDGDTTRIAPGMCFAVDGGITVTGEFGARIGDSVVVTEDGFEYLTDFPRELTVL